MTTKNRYSAWSERQALRQADEPGVMDALVCEELSISTRQLRCWLANSVVEITPDLAGTGFHVADVQVIAPPPGAERGSERTSPASRPDDHRGA